MNVFESAKLKAFENKNIPFVVDVVEPLWSPPVGDKEFKRFNVEFIVRNNISENDLHFELLDGATEEFLSAAFFTKKGDACKVEEWYEKESIRFPSNLKKATEMSRAYLNLMDRRTLDLMGQDDIKLSLFVSRKPGGGSEILSRLFAKLRGEGWKNLYLWTDCDCNWKWYEKRGFSLVQEDVYQPFSDENEKYKTYIFRKAL